MLRLVAENRTSKEIAWELGISESAVNQRIEGVRGRTGSPPRAELARAYRFYQRQDPAQTALLDGAAPVTPGDDLVAGEGAVSAQDPAGAVMAAGPAPAAAADAACNPLPEKNPQVPAARVIADGWLRDEPGNRLTLSDGVTFRVEAPWHDEPVERIVPEVLDGPDAGVNRVAAMVLIAGGLLLVAVFGLDLATALSRHL
ncbi:helix-turn-helix domain-containing protein [Novosphingobium clariflavum]|uniref:LuxR family transcriptional regulator n=1 Tax=Novosphingobium clariflavum TaxID=2029884 RepID=A0ABV6S319_9SPHN|nr:LuxR family transcriptional regulator [Novosphingobium clariflavum]